MDTEKENAHTDGEKPVDDKIVLDPAKISAQNQCRVLRQLIIDKEHNQNARRIKETAITMQETFLNERRRAFLRRLETACGLPPQEIDRDEFRGFRFFREFYRAFKGKHTDRDRVAFVDEFLKGIFDGEKPTVDSRAESLFSQVCVAFAKSPYAEEIYLAENANRRKREQENAEKWIKWTQSQFARLQSKNRERQAIELSKGEKHVLAKFYDLEKARQRLDRFSKSTFDKARQKHADLENAVKIAEKAWTQATRKTPASDPVDATPEEIAQAKQALRKHNRVWKKKPLTEDQRRKNREYKRKSLAKFKARSNLIAHTNHRLETIMRAFDKERDTSHAKTK